LQTLFASCLLPCFNKAIPAFPQKPMYLPQVFVVTGCAGGIGGADEVRSLPCHGFTLKTVCSTDFISVFQLVEVISTS